MSKNIGTNKKKSAGAWENLINVCKAHPIYIPYVLLILGCLIAMFYQAHAWCLGLSLAVALFPVVQWLIPKVVCLIS